jgi:phage gp46-like protein
MPTDIALTWDTDLEGCKIGFASNDLVTSMTLLTPVLISLFTDARAADDDVLPDTQVEDRRGWWGDSTNTNLANDSVGSRLWLLEREKNVDSVLKNAKTYIQEALQWMLDEGVAKSIDVIVEADAIGSAGLVMLAYQISITKPDGTTEAFKFEREWEATV